MAEPQSNYVLGCRLSKDRPLVSTTCGKGGITVLTDAHGDDLLREYALLFSGSGSSGSLTLACGGEPVGLDHCSRVGLGDAPPSGTVAEILSALAPADAARLLEEYELERHALARPSQLSPTAGRQLSLLQALYSPAPVLALNDPFSPFNGRWREHFAELLIRDAVTNGRTIIVLQLSFIPNVWSKAPQVRFVDIGAAAEVATRKAEKEAALEAQIRAAAAAVPESAAPLPGRQKKADVYELPAHIRFAYKAVSDNIFEPLANLSHNLRTFSGFATALAIVAVALLGGVILYPNLGLYRQKLQQLAVDFDFIEPTPAPVPHKVTKKTGKAQPVASPGAAASPTAGSSNEAQAPDTGSTGQGETTLVLLTVPEYPAAASSDTQETLPSERVCWGSREALAARFETASAPVLFDSSR